MSEDISARLREAASELQEAWLSDPPRDPSLNAALPAYLFGAADTIARLRARVGELEERLEIKWAWQLGTDGEMVRVPAPEGMPDGIECRDETIRLLEARLQPLSAQKGEA